MFKRTLLSRVNGFNGTHGLKQEQKDYLSVIKNQGQEGLCWAYALTSTIEMSYALKTGNRLMLDPLTLYNNSVPWFNKLSEKDKQKYKPCLEYGEDKTYYPSCALVFMAESKQTMRQMDGEDSFLQITGGDEKEIKSLKDLYDILDKYGIIYSGVNSTYLYGEIIEEYIDADSEDVHPDHAVVITAAGTLKGYEGVYIEVLNSWGYENGYDGLHYVKIADNEDGSIVNNMKLFDENYVVNVKRSITAEEAVAVATGAIACAVVFGILFLIALIIMSIYIYLYYKMRKFDYENAKDPEV